MNPITFAQDLGRVSGHVARALLATLVVLPTVFAIVQGAAGRRSASLDPFDPDSAHFHPEAAGLVANGDGQLAEAAPARLEPEHPPESDPRVLSGA